VNLECDFSTVLLTNFQRTAPLTYLEWDSNAFIPSAVGSIFQYQSCKWCNSYTYCE